MFKMLQEVKSLESTKRTYLFAYTTKLINNAMTNGYVSKILKFVGPWLSLVRARA